MFPRQFPGNLGGGATDANLGDRDRVRPRPTTLLPVWHDARKVSRSPSPHFAKECLITRHTSAIACASVRKSMRWATCFPAATNFAPRRSGNNCPPRESCGCWRTPWRWPRPSVAKARSHPPPVALWPPNGRRLPGRLRSTIRHSQSGHRFRGAMRTAHLGEGIAVSRQRERTAKIQTVIKDGRQLFISCGREHDFRRIFQHPQNHGSRGDANPDVVFDDVPLSRRWVGHLDGRHLTGP